MGLGLPAKDSARIDTMLRMLASDRDGEVISAARMIGRILATNKLSFHEIAAAVSAAPGTSSAPPPPPAQRAWSCAPDDECDAQDDDQPPSCATLRRPKQLAWARLILERLQLEDRDAAVLADAARKMTATDCYFFNRGQVRVLDRLIRRAWRVGLRP